MFQTLLKNYLPQPNAKAIPWNDLIPILNLNTAEVLYIPRISEELPTLGFLDGARNDMTPGFNSELVLAYIYCAMLANYPQIRFEKRPIGDEFHPQNACPPDVSLNSSTLLINIINRPSDWTKNGESLSFFHWRN